MLKMKIWKSQEPPNASLFFWSRLSHRMFSMVVDVKRLKFPSVHLLCSIRGFVSPSSTSPKRVLLDTNHCCRRDNQVPPRIKSGRNLQPACTGKPPNSSSTILRIFWPQFYQQRGESAHSRASDVYHMSRTNNGCWKICTVNAWICSCGFTPWETFFDRLTVSVCGHI